MRFVLAIISFVVAALALGFGVAERTVLAGPNHVTATVTSSAAAPVVVIDGSALNAYANTQTVALSGSSTTFAAYGRTSDIMAWIGDTEYNHVRFSRAGKLQSIHHTGAATTVPSPSGSDLWLAQYTGTEATNFKIKIPANMSVIVVSNGTLPAPSTVALTWPLDNSTPWSGPLILVGAIALLLGLILLLWAFTHLRRTRGPRRSPMPKLPRQPRYKPKRRELTSSKGRRAVRRVAIAAPSLLVTGLVLAGCVAAPAPQVETTSTPSGLTSGTKAPRPAVTPAQLQIIVDHLASTVSLADSTLNPTLITSRMEGAALADRLANYIIRKRNPKLAASISIPSNVELTVPVARDAWPHTVFTVVQNKAQPTIAPVALMLVQNSPRENYKIDYAISLQPKVVLPDLAPASVGASRLPAEIGLLKLQPSAIALAYGDILDKDTASTSYADFDPIGDTFRQQVGLASKKALQKKLPATAKLTFSNENGTGQVIPISTNNSGAIVAVDLNEVETVRPVQAGAAVSTTGGTAALSGKSTSTKGIVATYGDQLLFYVPKAGSSGKIELLGYTQGLVSAVEYKKAK